MTQHQAEVMREHACYWTGLAERGVAIIFGPVADPKGVWGMGVIETKDEAELRKLQESDPVIKARLGNRYEVYAMPRVIIRRQDAELQGTETKNARPGQKSESK